MDDVLIDLLKVLTEKRKDELNKEVTITCEEFLDITAEALVKWIMEDPENIFLMHEISKLAAILTYQLFNEKEKEEQ